MNIRPRRPGSASLDALLDGDRDDGTPVARVLTAARVPGTPAELARLDSARAAFLGVRRGAHRSAVPAATRTAAGRLLVLKAIAALSGATLVGGVAYAATNTHLLGGGSHNKPGQHQSAAPSGNQDGSNPGAGGQQAQQPGAA